MTEICFAMLCLLCTSFSFNFGIAQRSGYNRTACSRIELIHKEVIVGWPIGLSCIEIFEESYYADESSHSANGYEAECLIVDGQSNVTLWEEKVSIPNRLDFDRTLLGEYQAEIALNSSRVYYIILKASNSKAECLYNEVVLNITEDPGMTCKQASKSTYHFNFEAQDRRTHKLNCVLFDGDQTFKSYPATYNYTVSWQRNCSELDPKLFPNTYRKEGSALFFNSATFGLAGVYSCALTYKGRTRFKVFYDVCVSEPNAQPSQILLSCPESKKSKFGETVVISCTVNLGFGRLNAIYLSGKWGQNPGNNSCQNSLAGTSTGRDKRTTCSFNNVQNANRKCFIYDPPAEQKIPTENIWTMNLTIRNFQQTDVGNYTAVFYWLDHTASARVRLYEQVYFPDPYFYAAVCLAALIGTFVILVISILIYIRTRPTERSCL